MAAEKGRSYGSLNVLLCCRSLLFTGTQQSFLLLLTLSSLLFYLLKKLISKIPQTLTILFYWLHQLTLSPTPVRFISQKPRCCSVWDQHHANPGTLCFPAFS